MFLNRTTALLFSLLQHMQRYASIKDIENKGVIFCPTWRYNISFTNKRLLFTLYCIFDAPQHASFNCKLPTRDTLAFYPPQLWEKKMKNESIKWKNCIFHTKMILTYYFDNILHPMYSVSYSTIYTLWIYLQFHTLTKNRIVHYATATLIKRWATMGLSNVILKLSRTISEGMPFFFIRL